MQRKPSKQFLSRLESARQTIADYRAKFGNFESEDLRQIANGRRVNEMLADMREALKTGTPITDWGQYMPQFRSR